MWRTTWGCSRRMDERSSSASTPTITTDPARCSRTQMDWFQSPSRTTSLTDSDATLKSVAAYLDSVPFSGIIRIRDLMYSIADPYRLDQGDLSFDAPDSVKSAMRRAIDENKTHYLQTTGVPRLRQLIAAKLRGRNGIPIDDDEQV